MKITKLITIYSFLTLALSTMLYGMDDEQKIEEHSESTYRLPEPQSLHTRSAPQGIFITLGNSKKPTLLPEFYDHSFEFKRQRSTKIYHDSIQTSNQYAMDHSKDALQNLRLYLLENLLLNSKFEHTNERCREYTQFLGYKATPNSDTLNRIARRCNDITGHYDFPNINRILNEYYNFRIMIESLKK